MVKVITQKSRKKSTHPDKTPIPWVQLPERLRKSQESAIHHNLDFVYTDLPDVYDYQDLILLQSNISILIDNLTAQIIDFMGDNPAGKDNEWCQKCRSKLYISKVQQSIITGTIRHQYKINNPGVELYCDVHLDELENRLEKVQKQLKNMVIDFNDSIDGVYRLLESN